MDPSSPTSEPDLSAALEDAEGRALAEAIMRRRVTACTAAGLHSLDGCQVCGVPVKGLMTHETGWRAPEKIGARVEMTWQDVSYEFMALMLGYSSVEEMHKASEERRIFRETVEGWSTEPLPVNIPEIASVRWVCKAPTEPVYAEGTDGWLTEQVLARITPAQREYNRKLTKENAAVMDRFAKLLGVKPYGADD